MDDSKISGWMERLIESFEEQLSMLRDRGSEEIQLQLEQVALHVSNLSELIVQIDQISQDLSSVDRLEEQSRVILNMLS